MRQLLDLMLRVRDEGVRKPSRPGVDTLSVFGPQIEFDLSKGLFPAMTTRPLAWKAMTTELLWYLRGEPNVAFLTENGVTIWDEWADENGDLGPVYGVQWRSWPNYGGGTIDQLAKTISMIKSNPNDRRLLVNAWNVAQLDEMALPPCHVMFQFYVAEGRLSCKLYQRSADLPVGVPFNIASYSLLTMMVAQVTGLKPGRFIHTFGDAHIYTDQLELLEQQFAREPKPLPQMLINPAIKDIDAFTLGDFQLQGYHPHRPQIRFPVAV